MNEIRNAVMHLNYFETPDAADMYGQFARCQ